MKVAFTGINIQFPISRLILSGEKTIETRTYPIPPKLISEDLVIIETPGRSGAFKSRMVGLIRFANSFEYESEPAFYRDERKHKVSRSSPWAWNQSKGKWGWPIVNVREFREPLPLLKPTGIRYSTGINLDPAKFLFR